MQTTFLCSIRGCPGLTGVKGTARGYCHAHYQKWRKYGDPLKVVKIRIVGVEPCTIDGCDRVQRARGWCATHHQRWREHGSPHVNLREGKLGGGLKWCPQCQSRQPLENFGTHAGTRSGLSAYCKPCGRARAKMYRSRPGYVPHQKTPEQMRAGAKRYREKHPDKVREYTTLRRARRNFAPVVERVSPLRVMERDGWTCQICGGPIDPAAKYPDLMSRSVDHRIPLVAGGHHTYENCQAAHLTCNLSKSDKMPA